MDNVYRWKGSIYKLLWQPVLLYFGLYMLLTIIYDFGLGEAGRKEFEAVALYCSRYTSSIPVILLLGFFTSTAMQRWFTTQTSVPGTARAITVFTLSLKESTPDAEQLVMQYSRWLLVSWVLAFRMICTPLKNQYPDLISLQSAGLLLDHERVILEEEEINGGHATLSLTVLDWIFHLLKRVNRQGNYNATNDFARNVEVVLSFKKSCGNTIKFSSKNIPFANSSCRNHSLRFWPCFADEPPVLGQTPSIDSSDRLSAHLALHSGTRTTFLFLTSILSC